MDKYQNKYRSPSTRAPWWDYGWTGAYFVTICTHNRKHFFGEIVQKQLMASPLGKWADILWRKIPDQFPYAELGNFVIMPDHIHGILILNNPGHAYKIETVRTRLIASVQQSNALKSGGFAGNKNPMLNKNISRIIRWYKGRCAFEMRKIDANFAWQSRFHDRIIRNDAEFQRISNYIANNPANWKGL